MLGLLRALPFLALAAAAADTFLVRRAQEHRVPEATLFWQAAILWASFGLLALAPARVTLPLLRRPGRDVPGRERWGVFAGALGFWMALPVLVHGRLDRFTTIGQDVSALASPWPWIQVVGVILALAFAAWLAPRATARLRGSWTALAALAASLGVGLFVPAAGAAASPVAAATAPAGAPNLLLLVWDTTRSQNTQPYGYGRPTTPRLAELARESVVYAEARSVSCFTLTSHVSMLTGVYPSHHGASLLRMTYDPRATPSVARLLRAAGYRTGAFVGTGVLRANTGVVDGFEVYDDLVDPPVCDTHAWALVHDVQAVLARLSPRFNGNGMPHWFQDFQRPAPEVLNAAYRWIRERDARPWFCMVNLYDVHWPYTPGEKAKAAFVEPYEGIVDGYLFRGDSYERPPGVARGARIQPGDRRHLIQLYDAEMFELDHHVGTFLEALDLESSGTAVVLTSDHGEGFGEAGRFEHDDICEPQVRVPFLVYEPRGEGREPRKGEARVRVSGVDVAPTLLGLAGVPVPGHMTGIDLAHEDPEPDRLILVEDRDKLHAKNHHYAVYRGPWKLLQTGVGEGAKVELFDLRIDQVGMYDVGDQSPHVRASLLEELRALRATWGGDAERFDERGVAGNRATHALGYGGGDEDE